MTATRLPVIAATALAALIAISLAFPLLPLFFGGSVPMLPPGTILAIVKVAALAFVFKRVRRADNYTLQWSSMFILLFFAEGVVRAMTDPRPAALLGGAEIVVTVVYFVATLVILRPLKKHARAADGR